MANGVDPDQTPRSAASDLGLHCSPKSVWPDTLGKYGNSSISIFSGGPDPNARILGGSGLFGIQGLYRDCSWHTAFLCFIIYLLIKF